jgi:hypothetical protein
MVTYEGHNLKSRSESYERNSDYQQFKQKLKNKLKYFKNKSKIFK